MVARSSVLRAAVVLALILVAAFPACGRSIGSG